MRTPRQISRGSITLVALSLAIVIGISLASYLALCQQSLLFSTRTIQLSKARQLAETGLEEALWALNTSANPDSTIAATAWNSTMGPTLPATAITWDSNPPLTPDDRHALIEGYDLGEGATGLIDITINNYNGPVSTTVVPYLSPIINVTATVTVSGSVFVKKIRATTKPAPLFVNALGIANGYNGRLIFNGGGVVDSWDSDYLAYAPLGPISVPASPTPRPPNRDYSSTTQYPGKVPDSIYTSPALLPSPYNTAPLGLSSYPDLTFNYAAVIAAPRITLGGAEIRGYATTFGNSINVTTGAGGSQVLGPPVPNTPITPTLDSTRVGKSAFVPTFKVAKPLGFTGNLVATYTTNGTNLSVNGGVWYAPSGLEVDGNTNLPDGVTLDITEPSVIIVQGDLHLWRAGRIRVIPPNGRLEIFVTGNVIVGPFPASTAGFQNDTNEPKRLALYSTGSSRTFQYQSNREFCGVIFSSATYPPAGDASKATIQFFAANQNLKFYGAILANYNIEFDGTPEIHYDTALQYLPRGWFKGVTTPYIIVQVTES